MICGWMVNTLLPTLSALTHLIGASSICNNLFLTPSAMLKTDVSARKKDAFMIINDWLHHNAVNRHETTAD
jgi:hypothetical protein